MLARQDTGFLALIWDNCFVPEAQSGLIELKNPSRVCNAPITYDVAMNFVVGMLCRIRKDRRV